MIKLSNVLIKPTSGVHINRPLKLSNGAFINNKVNVVYNKAENEKYKTSFNRLKEEKVFYEYVKFEDHQWIGMYDDLNTTLDFSKYRYNTTIYFSLKFYVIILLEAKILTLRYAQLALSEIIKCISLTNNFHESWIGSFEDYLASKKEGALVDIRRYIYYYLLFIDVKGIYSSYLQVLAELPTNKESRTRLLPNYESIINFDLVINDFFSKKENEELQKKYYPILLWWKITTVIPMRPNEFLKLKYDGCYQIGSDYYIEVIRSKIRPNLLSTHHNVEKIDKLKTNEEIFNLIMDFKQKLNLKNEKYLFSHNAFLGISQLETHLQRRSNQEKVRVRDFGNLLKKFYTEIIEGYYNYKSVSKGNNPNDGQTIELLQPGDTRHLAFCSMMLQGFNPLTIADMGGHQTLNTQNHYTNHIREFCDAQTLMLTNYLKLNLNRFDNDINEILFSKDKRNLGLRRYNDAINPRKIDSGLCYCESFPSKCCDSCLLCDYYKIDWTTLTDNEKRKFRKELNKTKEEIEIKLNFLIRVYKDMFKETRNYEEKFISNELKVSDLQREGACIQDLMKKQAVLEVGLSIAKGE